MSEQYFDLGSHTRLITTSSAQAQLWFNRGLNWCFGFNQEEAVTCFLKALEHDPKCAMAYWGVAYAAGPFYNMPWCDFSVVEATTCTQLCYDNSHKAESLASTVTAVEAALIHALTHRFQQDNPVSQLEFNQWDDAYADAMRKVHKDYPEDSDVIALFAEAMMTRTPWKLWEVHTNTPTLGADTIETLEILEAAIARTQQQGITPHPAILHLHIHVLEMSSAPDQALTSADNLADLCPEAGHMNHMPGHIYVLCGLYEKAKIASEKAIIADRKYLEYAGPYNFYTTARCHDLHLMMYTCMFLGQFEPAMAAANEMCGTLTRDVLEMKDRPYLAMTMEGYYSMAVHVLIRFGKWQQIVDTPMPVDPDLYCVSTSMQHYAKGVAHSALGHFDQAEEHRNDFRDSLTRIPLDRRFFNNTAFDILGVAEKMLDGEFEYHQGNHSIAYQHLRDGVQRDDNLAYSEPWAWMHPPRHALGALLLEQGHYEEAEVVYREDLGLASTLQRCAQHPDNVWALHGLSECLSQRDAHQELEMIRPKLNAAMALTDTPINSSCCCRKHTTPVS